MDSESKEAGPGLARYEYENLVDLTAASPELTSLVVDIATERYFHHRPQYQGEEFRVGLSEAAFDKDRQNGPAVILAGLWAKGMEFNAREDTTALFIKYPFRLKKNRRDFSFLNSQSKKVKSQPEQAVEGITQVGNAVAQDPEAASLFNEWLSKLLAQIQKTGLIETSLGRFALR